jgi:LPXTG-motif cell wall-anchored protein
MAIDMIEDNELAALAPSRIGLRQYVDDGAKGTPKMLNFTGNDDFANLFGSRKKKKSVFRDAVRAKYGVIPTDCDSIMSKIEVVNSDLETLVKRSAGKSSLEIKEKLDETNIVIGELKSALIKQGCKSQLLAQEKSEAEQKATQTLKTLSEIGETQVERAKIDLLGGASTTADKSNKMILIYGGLALLAIIGVFYYVKKKK